MSQVTKWREILKRIIDVVLFLGERGLAFMGLSQRIGDPHNGNFLGIIELVSRYDPVLQLHVNKMGEAQRQGNRVPVHYLSSDSQNEFIAACAGQVQAKILYNLKEAKYYSMIVDATQDSAHMEQTTFILRYVSLPKDGTSYEIHETFVDCNKKTGSDIAELNCVPCHHIIYQLNFAVAKDMTMGLTWQGNIKELRHVYKSTIIWQSSHHVLFMV